MTSRIKPVYRCLDSQYHYLLIEEVGALFNNLFRIVRSTLFDVIPLEFSICDLIAKLLACQGNYTTKNTLDLMKSQIKKVIRVVVFYKQNLIRE